MLLGPSTLQPIPHPRQPKDPTQLLILCLIPRTGLSLTHRSRCKHAALSARATSRSSPATSAAYALHLNHDLIMAASSLTSSPSLEAPVCAAFGVLVQSCASVAPDHVPCLFSHVRANSIRWGCPRPQNPIVAPSSCPLHFAKCHRSISTCPSPIVLVKGMCHQWRPQVLLSHVYGHIRLRTLLLRAARSDGSVESQVGQGATR
ncbi:hypothetical protein BCR44DRAFT_346584 [Catenaria anguillulae PL171]|uniref:Uncharacterized protein n=1 Tax=Catenaria anguillulae PL171 TaxID=765915 RepID=A0A1Y2GZ16_9FUNG|nr:hypothetical protein BCR44DRAFT_346584 [Catenaria anguillulae PL171]